MVSPVVVEPLLKVESPAVAYLIDAKCHRKERSHVVDFQLNVLKPQRDMWLAADWPQHVLLRELVAPLAAAMYEVVKHIHQT